MQTSLAKKHDRSKMVLTIAFTVICIVYVLPIVIVLINSFKTNAAVNTDTFALPNEDTFVGWQNYIKGMTFGNYPFIKAVFYSLFITQVKLPYFSFTSMAFAKIGLNTPWTIPIVYLGFGAGLAVFMFSGFVKTIPLEIEEAAAIDGCGPVRTFFLVVLPMLFMTKPGFAQKIREYVENGGTVVATYLLGYVDESTLCWLGGFPGDGLREVFGVTASELDTLYPGEGNRAIWVKSSQQSSIKDYCELLQPAEGTEVVAVYGQDFYSGHAAVTHHVFGKGHAYYIGARLDDAGNAAVLRAALADAKVHLRDLPQGVEYYCRESENARYHFYINTTQSAVKVQVESGADLLSGKNVLGSMELKPYDACAIEEKVK